MAFYVDSAGHIVIAAGGGAVSSATTGALQDGDTFTIVAPGGTGFGARSGSLTAELFNNGSDAAFGSLSPQFDAVGSTIPESLGGIYDLQNQPVGFAPTGAPIGAPSVLTKAIRAGCNNDPIGTGGGVYQGKLVTLPNNGTVSTYPICMVYEFDYRYDPNWNSDPQSDNNLKETVINQGNELWAAGSNFWYSEPAPINQYGIVAISLANPLVVTFGIQQAQNPFSAGTSQIIEFFGIEGTTQLNGLTGAITAVGGSNGAWTVTVGSINASTFSAYAGALNVSGITTSTSAVMTLSTVGSIPLAIGDTVCFKIVGGMTGINGFSATILNTGGSSGAWTFNLGQPGFDQTGFSTIGMGTYTSGGVVTTGGGSVPYNNLMGTRSMSTNPFNMLQSPDANGHGSFWGSQEMPFNPSNGLAEQPGWIRRRTMYCWDATSGLGGGYCYIFDNNNLIMTMQGHTDTTSYAGNGTNVFVRAILFGNGYARDRSIQNFCYEANEYLSISGGGVSGQRETVYASDQTTWGVSGGNYVPQPNLTSWADGSITGVFNQGSITNSPRTINFFVLNGSATVNTAVTSPTTYTLSPTNVPTITTTSLPGATHGSAYSQAIAATGGVGTKSFVLASSNTGINPCANTWAVNSSTGQVTGTPTVTGTDTLFVTVIDSNKNPGWQQLNIVVS